MSTLPAWSTWLPTRGIVGPLAAPNSEERLKQLLRLGKAEMEGRTRLDENAPQKEAKTMANDAGSSSSSSGDTHRGTRRLPKSLGGDRVVPEQRLPCLPMTRDRFGRILHEFYGIQGITEEELRVKMGAQSEAQTTLRIVLGQDQAQPPDFAGSMWELIQSKKENVSARLYKDFFRLLVGHYLNEYVFEPRDFDGLDLELDKYIDSKTNNLSNENLEKIMNKYVVRVAAPLLDPTDQNFENVKEYALKEMRHRVDWMLAFERARELFGHTPRSFPPPKMDSYDLHRSEGCPKVILVDITVARAAVEFAMGDVHMFSSLHRAAIASAAEPEFPMDRFGVGRIGL